MKRETAIFIKEQALDAIQALSEIAGQCPSENSTENDNDMHKSAGILIGRIQMDILETIYASHPDLDDISQD
jgi:hypothetical protein